MTGVRLCVCVVFFTLFSLCQSRHFKFNWCMQDFMAEKDVSIMIIKWWHIWSEFFFVSVCLCLLSISFLYVRNLLWWHHEPVFITRFINYLFYCISHELCTVPMMNHHTMPKYGFGKTSMGSFYLPKICTKGGGIGGGGKCGSGNNSHNTVSLELSHGNNKQLITLPAEKLDNNKRYFTLMRCLYSHH